MCAPSDRPPTAVDTGGRCCLGVHLRHTSEAPSGAGMSLCLCTFGVFLMPRDAMPRSASRSPDLPPPPQSRPHTPSLLQDTASGREAVPDAALGVFPLVFAVLYIAVARRRRPPAAPALHVPLLSPVLRRCQSPGAPAPRSGPLRAAGDDAGDALPPLFRELEEVAPPPPSVHLLLYISSCLPPNCPPLYLPHPLCVARLSAGVSLYPSALSLPFPPLPPSHTHSLTPSSGTLSRTTTEAVPSGVPWTCNGVPFG